MGTKLEEQIDRALKVLGSYTKPRVHIVRPAKPRGGKLRAYPATRVGPRGGHTDVQALLFPLAAGWTPARAKAWAKKNGFHYGKVHVKGHHVRLRQRDPGEYRRMRTMCLDDACHVKAIIGVR